MIEPISLNFPFLYHPEIVRNRSFFDIFTEYRNETLTRNGFKFADLSVKKKNVIQIFKEM